MSGTGNQIILQILRQLHEIRTVACNPHNQVAVLLRHIPATGNIKPHQAIASFDKDISSQ